MNFHIFVTIFLVVFNGLLMFSFPQETFLDGNSFIQLVEGEQVIDVNNNEITSSVQNKLDGADGSTLNSFGIFDGFSLIIDFVKFLLGFLIALPVFLIKTNLFDFTFKFFFFIPMFIAYMYSLLSWVRTGGSS